MIVLCPELLIDISSLGYNAKEYDLKNNTRNEPATSSLKLKEGKSWWRGRDKNTLHNEHPHKGALFNGSIGIIVDPSPEQLQSFFALSEKEKNELIDQLLLCPKNKTDTLIEGWGGNEVLQKIKRGVRKSMQYVNGSDDNNLSRNCSSKILCMIYTVNLPGDNHTNLCSIAQTWGRKCDGFLAASNSTDHSIGAINLLHKYNETYGNMWQKIRSMWTYAYNHYIDDFDFFYICGDNTYLSIPNMRAYLDGPEVYALEYGY